jgi:hypothetical protein
LIGRPTIVAVGAKDGAEVDDELRQISLTARAQPPRIGVARWAGDGLATDDLISFAVIIPIPLVFHGRVPQIAHELLSGRTGRCCSRPTRGYRPLLESIIGVSTAAHQDGSHK